MKPEQFKTVFIDSDKPEVVKDIKKPTPPPPPPEKPKPRPYGIHRTHADPMPPREPRPAPPLPPECRITIEDSIPNPTPHRYIDHPRPAPHPPKHYRFAPRHELQWEEDHAYVTKKELNRVLQNIADADIFRDLSTNGTTVSVGGITKGTKFSKVTFSQLVEKMLYPTDGTDGAYVTQGELEELLSKVAFSGLYSDLEDIPENLDYEYPCEDEEGRTLLNSEVTNAVGGFSEGDSLKGMTIAQILEKLLCGDSNKWGSYVWKTDLYDLESGTTVIDANEFCPKLVSELDAATDSEYEQMMTDGVYEMYAVCTVSDKEDESTYRYDVLIALSDTTDGDTPQITVPWLPDVPADLTWSYNSVTQEITLSTGITTNICLIMIRR